ncbi:Uncharacterized protein SCF082_LOCUS8506 [Durusdinium trenchii]|uniref:H(+)-exporting diphosphatase n=1 Tax=Durusdinium trenchii TaxID=1381693 RepID=A0ABP0ITG5_9DINO
MWALGSSSMPILMLAISSPVGWAIAGSFLAFGIMGTFFCWIEMDGVNKNFRDCVKYALLSPLKAVKFLAKAAWRISKKAFRFIRGKKETSTSTVSDLQITGSTERMVDSCFDRFISHYWGEHLEKFLEGVRQHLAVRGLSGRTGYWLGAFATRHTAAWAVGCGVYR